MRKQFMFMILLLMISILVFGFSRLSSDSISLVHAADPTPAGTFLLTGYIFDKTTNQVIPGASVSGVITDNGYYSRTVAYFSNDGSSILIGISIQASGYETLNTLMFIPIRDIVIGVAKHDFYLAAAAPTPTPNLSKLASKIEPLYYPDATEFFVTDNAPGAIKVKLTDGAGNPLAGRTVVFMNYSSYWSFLLDNPNPVTDASGIATTNATYNMDPGRYGGQGVTVAYNGDDTYNGSNCYVFICGYSSATPISTGTPVRTRTPTPVRTIAWRTPTPTKRPTPTATGVPGTFVVSGYVYGVDGVMQGVSVSSSGGNASTDASGYYSLSYTYYNTRPTSITVSATKYAYISQSITVNVPPTGDVTANFNLIPVPTPTTNPLITVSGEIYDSITGGWISGATVTMGPETTTSNIAGYYSVSYLYPIRPEAITVTVSAPGYQTQSRSYRVGYDGNARIHFYLVPLAGATPTVTPTPTPVPPIGAIKVQFYNQETSAIGNQIYANFKLVNNGTSAITLSNVKIRYYYTIDGVKPQNFWCDYSPVGSQNITGTFVSISPAKIGADTYLEVGFTSGAGNLAAGAGIVIQTRTAKNDWSNYNHTNDYSFNSSATTYVDWTKITGYLSGVLQWGTEP